MNDIILLNKMVWDWSQAVQDLHIDIARKPFFWRTLRKVNIETVDLGRRRQYSR